MSDLIDDPVIARITANGQISLPADIRRRWAVSRVAIIDRGDLAIVRAVPDDPVTHYRGRFKRAAAPTSAQMRDDGRAEEIEQEAAKQRRIDSK